MNSYREADFRKQPQGSEPAHKGESRCSLGMLYFGSDKCCRQYTYVVVVCLIWSVVLLVAQVWLIGLNEETKGGVPEGCTEV